MNLFANFIIYRQLISDDIPELGLISIEILPITTLLAIVNWETQLVPLRVDALIWTKTIVGVLVLKGYRAIATQMTSLISRSISL